MILFAFAGAIACVMGVIGIAHIENPWLRWFSMVSYVVVIVLATFGLPMLIEATT